MLVQQDVIVVLLMLCVVGNRNCCRFGLLVKLLLLVWLNGMVGFYGMQLLVLGLQVGLVFVVRFVVVLYFMWLVVGLQNEVLVVVLVVRMLQLLVWFWLFLEFWQRQLVFQLKYLLLNWNEFCSVLLKWNVVSLLLEMCGIFQLWWIYVIFWLNGLQQLLVDQMELRLVQVLDCSG